MLQPFEVAAATLDRYRHYVRTGFPLSDPSLDEQREWLIAQHGLLWTAPHVALSRPGTGGPPLADFADRLADETLALSWGFDQLYEHQAKAIDRLRVSRPGGPASTLVLSGTGSGKTEAFLIPIVDACLRDPSPGTKAVLIYPMNALANDQLERLGALLAGSGVTFGRYTGDAPETDGGGEGQPPRPGDAPDNMRWSRQAMRNDPPQILITNYLQLELLLLRGADRQLFRYGAPTYVVVDEIHLFTGVLGSEVAALLRRFRQHVGARPNELVVVGTSATAGSDTELDRLVDFAGHFFGVPFERPAAAVSEVPRPTRDPGDITPPAPELSDELLAGPLSDDGLRALALTTLGLELDPSLEGDELRRALGERIDDYRTISEIERAFDRPASLEAAIETLARLPERANSRPEDLRREAEALLLLGSQAAQHEPGEREPSRRLRPRVHQMVRSLAGLARCINPACGELLPAGQGRCTSCESRALPLASCRSCGFAYWNAPASGGLLEPAEPDRDTPSLFLADPEALAAEIEEDEEGGRHRWDELTVCPGCGAFAAQGEKLSHADDCPTPESAGVLLQSSQDGRHCRACGSIGAAGRAVLTLQRGAAAASVAVVTQVLGDTLRDSVGHAGARLLVFSDSRQNAGQQAGYADDQGARVAIRQLLHAALSEAGKQGAALPDLVRAIKGNVASDDAQLRRWLIGEAGEELPERIDPAFVPSTSDSDRLLNQLEWEVVLELTERARRRFSLEGQGLAIVTLDRLDELAAGVTERWPDHPFGTTEQLAQAMLAVADALRFSRAVGHRFLLRKPSALRLNHGLHIGDRSVTMTRGYARRSHTQRRDEVDIRVWHSRRAATRIAELIGRVIGEQPASEQVEGTVYRLVDELTGVGLLVDRPVDSRHRDVVADARLVIRGAPTELYRCRRCGHVRGSLLTTNSDEPLCITWRCGGRPEAWTRPPGRGFYREQYEAEPRRLVVREHSGQVQSEMRIALEKAFNDRERVPLDVLACTPTLEVGVSLDDLNAVVLRNLPPSPANYAQRVGRAGRRSKVALALAHAGHGPHDSYFFERPDELIAGEVRAPAISLANEPLLRRHVNSLILETLAIELPGRWVPDPGEETDDTIADDEGVVRESVIQPFRDGLADETTRRQVLEAVRGAFLAADDPAKVDGIGELAERRVAEFPEDLKAALERWCQRFRALEEERRQLAGRRRLTEAERRIRNRLEAEVERMAEAAAPDRRPLGFLGLVGFLPRYGATGERALLVTPYTDAPIDQAAYIAITDFAPGNVVYARGRRLRVTRLHPRPVPDVEGGSEFRDNVVRSGRRCDECQFFTTDLLQRTCPRDHDLVDQQVIELTGVRGGGGAITGDDEYRARAAYDVLHTLGPPGDDSEVLSLGGYELTLTRRREITVANRGPVPDELGVRATGFAVCSECGHAQEDPGGVPDPEGEESEVREHRGHSPRCPARQDPRHDCVLHGAWLIARLQGDVLEIPLAPGQGSDGLRAWRRSLVEALMLGIRETMQAGRRDLAAFEVTPAGETERLVIFDTLPGGTGYLPKLLAGDGAGLREVTDTALARLASCICEASCHRCLRDFWNQRDHALLDRRAVIPTLRRLAQAVGTPQLPDEDERLMSFLELEFHKRLREADLPAPTLQVIHRLPDGRITVADFAYSTPDVSIFLDGRAYHAQSEQKIRSDLRKRNELEADGRIVLEFTYADVMERFDEVVEMVRHALVAARDGTRADGAPPEGLTIVDLDEATRRAKVQINPENWIASEEARQSDLAAANQARLAGWRLERMT